MNKYNKNDNAKSPMNATNWAYFRREFEHYLVETMPDDRILKCKNQSILWRSLYSIRLMNRFGLISPSIQRMVNFPETRISCRCLAKHWWQNIFESKWASSFCIANWIADATKGLNSIPKTAVDAFMMMCFGDFDEKANAISKFQLGWWRAWKNNSPSDHTFEVGMALLQLIAFF